MVLRRHVCPMRCSAERLSIEFVCHCGNELSNGRGTLATVIATAILCPNEPLPNRLTKGGEEKLRRQLSAMSSACILHRRSEPILPSRRSRGFPGNPLLRPEVTAGDFTIRTRMPFACCVDFDLSGHRAI